MADRASNFMALMKAAYKQPDKGRVGDPSIHVSNLIDFCPKTYFLCVKHDRTLHPKQWTDMRIRWIWDMGYAIQDMMEMRLKTVGALVGAWRCRHCGYLEIRIQNDKRKCPKCKCRSWRYRDLGLLLKLPIKKGKNKGKHVLVRGNLDIGIAIAPDEGFIVDAKSIKEADYDKLEKPVLSHIRQVSLYMWLIEHMDAEFVGTPYPEDLFETFSFDTEQGVLAYGCKGTRQIPIKTFNVDIDIPFLKRTEGKLKKVVKSIETGRSPLGVCKSKFDLMAKKCPVRDICFGNVLKGAKKGGKKK